MSPYQSWPFFLQRNFLSQTHPNLHNDTNTSENSQSQVDEKWQLKSYNSKRKYIFKCCKIPLSSTSLPRLQVEICACQKWVLLVPFFDIIPEFPQKLRTIKVSSEVRCRTESDHKTLKDAESPTEHCKILATWNRRIIIPYFIWHN